MVALVGFFTFLIPGSWHRFGCYLKSNWITLLLLINSSLVFFMWALCHVSSAFHSFFRKACLVQSVFILHVSSVGFQPRKINAMFIILTDCNISRTFPLGGFFPRVLYVQTCQTLQTGMERSVFALSPLHALLLLSDLTMWNLEPFWKNLRNSWKIWSKRGRGIKRFL